MNAQPDAFDTTAAALPKVLLHDHLDGGLRVATLWDLLHHRGLTPPAADERALAHWFDDNTHAGSLDKYLTGFALTVAAMATPAALRRVALEAAEDGKADGAVLAEFRIAPLLFEPYGVSGEAAVEAILQGLADSPLPLGQQSGLIVCALRHLPESETVRAVALALKYRGQGVVGFDLAGGERGHPASDHAAALALAREAGLPMTLHAGEDDAALRVLEAARLGARRIGHGVRLVDALHDPLQSGLVSEAIERGIHLEICPSSNVHTGVARSIAAHPITALWRRGVSLSWQPDNRLISRCSASSEAAALLRHTALTPADLLAMVRQAAQHSFLPLAQRQAALNAIDAQGTAG